MKKRPTPEGMPSALDKRRNDTTDDLQAGGSIAPELAGWLALLAVAAMLVGWR